MYTFWPALIIIMDVIFHPALPQGHAIAISFFFRLLARPTIMLNTVNGDDCPSAIGPLVAMNKDSLVRSGVDEGQYPVHLGIGWPAESIQGHIEVAQAGGPCLLLFSARAF